MRALIIIDMQPAYLDSPAFRLQKRSLITRVNQLALEYQQRGDLVIAMRTVHSRDMHTWTLNMLEDNQGFAFDETQESEVAAELQIEPAIHLVKTRDNAFHGTELLRILREHEVADITLAGVSAHSCVFHTAAAAYAYNYKVRLVVDAIGDEDDKQKKIALEYLRREYRQTLT